MKIKTVETISVTKEENEMLDQVYDFVAALVDEACSPELKETVDGLYDLLAKLDEYIVSVE